MSSPVELETLVAWARKTALASARVKSLPHHELVSAALHAVLGAIRTHDASQAPLAAHVRRRVRGELLDAAASESERRAREPLLDDLEAELAAGIEDDALALARAAGIEALFAGSPEESLLVHEARAVLDREVARLSRAEWRLYELRFGRGLGWNEVADELGISVRTAQYRAEELRERLAAALRAYRDEG